MEVSKQELREEEESEPGRGEEESGRGMMWEFSESWDKDGPSENVRMHKQRLTQINLIFGSMPGK